MSGRYGVMTEMKNRRLLASLVVLGILSTGTYLQQSAAAPRSASTFGDQYGCNTGVGPDVTVAAIYEVRLWGTVGDISGYSFGSKSLNIGDEWLPWVAGTNNHPVIGTTAYRVDDGGVEIIGTSWLKHGFGALQQGEFCDCESSGDFEFLGIGCSDPYCADLNGDQGGFIGIAGLGPRFQVNAHEGSFAFPYEYQGQIGDAIYKRLQIEVDDLDPSLNPGARYVVEVQYIAPADALAGNGMNNSSWREFTVGSFSSQGYALATVGDTTPRSPAIYAWAEWDEDVSTAQVQIPAEGVLDLAWRVTENEDGSWHYVYAIYNNNSNRSVRGVELPLDKGMAISNVQTVVAPFHSGEHYGTEPWTYTTDEVLWIGTDSYEVDPEASAIRFGTLHTVSFDSNCPPAPREMALSLFIPGTPDYVAQVVDGPACGDTGIPGDFTGDGQVNGEDLTILLGNWGSTDPEYDLDGSGGPVDGGDLTVLLGNWTG